MTTPASPTRYEHWNNRTLSEEYAYGQSDGYYAVEYALREGRGMTVAWHEDARESLREAETRRNRAYWLGYLRAYRDAARFWMGGRWGL